MQVDELHDFSVLGCMSRMRPWNCTAVDRKRGLLQRTIFIPTSLQYFIPFISVHLAPHPHLRWYLNIIQQLICKRFYNLWHRLLKPRCFASFINESKILPVHNARFHRCKCSCFPIQAQRTNLCERRGNVLHPICAPMLRMYCKTLIKSRRSFFSHLVAR